MKKVIGIPGWKTGDNSFGCGVNHLDFISEFGTPRIIFPQEDLVNVDLLYLPGGMDLSPSSYGEFPGMYTSNQDVFKQHFYDTKLKLYVENQTPIFGVCLGFQMLASYFGSKLTQHLHYHKQSSARWATAHPLVPVKGTWGEILFDKKFEVNSHHHQAVTLSNLSNELTTLFIAENEGNIKDPIVEVFMHNNLPIAGVQYHPEELRDNISWNIINDLMKL